MGNVQKLEKITYKCNSDFLVPYMINENKGLKNSTKENLYMINEIQIIHYHELIVQFHKFYKSLVQTTYGVAEIIFFLNLVVLSQIILHVNKMGKIFIRLEITFMHNAFTNSLRSGGSQRKEKKLPENISSVLNGTYLLWKMRFHHLNCDYTCSE